MTDQNKRVTRKNGKTIPLCTDKTPPLFFSWERIDPITKTTRSR